MVRLGQPKTANTTGFMLIMYRNHAGTDYLEIPALGSKPFIDKLLRVVREAQIKLSLKFDAVNLFYCLVNLLITAFMNLLRNKSFKISHLCIKIRYVLLVGAGHQEGVHGAL